MTELYKMIINTNLLSAKLKKNSEKPNIHNAIFKDKIKAEAKKFLISLTGNESFYSELYNAYKPMKISKTSKQANVPLNIKEITSNFDNCYDLLTDYTSYRNFI